MPTHRGRDGARRRLAAGVAGLVLLAGCASDDAPAGAGVGSPAPSGTTGASDSTTYPDVVEAVLTPESGGTYAVQVTMSSPYDTPERYADGWRVLDGSTVLGEMELAHDHAGEQPFTRNQTGLEIPDGVREVTVEGRDLVNGYGGGTVTVDVPGR